MGTTIAGTEVQGFCLEHDLCHQASRGPKLRGKLESRVALPPTTKPIYIYCRGHATSRRGYHDMTLGGSKLSIWAASLVSSLAGA
jgi:hypothetical protein